MNHFCKTIGLLFMTSALLAPGAGAADSAKIESLSLNGKWQARVTDESRSGEEQWHDMTVPGYFGCPRDKFVLFRRTAKIPADWKGKRIFLNFRGARYTPKFFVDGRLAGEQGDGWTPAHIEITDFAKPGGECEISVLCGGRGAVDKPNTTPDEVGRTIFPVGSWRDSTGIWLPASVEARGAVFVPESEWRISTSVRKGTVLLSGKVDGPASGTQVEAVFHDDDGKEAMRLGPVSVAKDGAWELRGKLAGVRLWSPESPTLYRLSLRTKRGGVLQDELVRKIGFKEFWIEGPDFFLNGVKRRLFASSTWAVMEWLPKEEVYRRVRIMKEEGVSTFRLHAQPWQEEFLDAADELGMLIVCEAAVYTDGEGFYAYKDKRLWKNWSEHLLNMIRRDRNRACVVMWSLGNEILFMNNQRFAKDLPERLGDLARLVKKFDSDHPVTFEADLDPDGAYDVIGLHYPHEMPQHHAYPNTADWMDRVQTTDAGGGMLGQRSGKFFWDRKKPLYIGEYLWVPQGDYGVGAIWFGDEAYRNRDKHHNLAKYAAWRDQTVAYRVAGVSALSPWAPYDFGAAPGDPLGREAQKFYFKRVAAYLRNRESRVFAGQRHVMTFDVLNDSLTKRSLTLSLRIDGKTVARKGVQLAPATAARVSLPFTPAEPGALSVSAVLSAGKKVFDRKDFLYRVEERRELEAPQGKRIAQWGGSGSATDMRSLNPKTDLLLIKENSVDGAFPTQSFHDFLRRGGRALVLEQRDVAPLGLGLELRDCESTMAHPISPTHPILNGLRAEDLKFWADGHWVAKKQFVRPESRGARAIAATGGVNGLEFCPIVEVPFGRGCVALLQMLCGEKRKTDPAAVMMMQNALNYLADLLESPAETALLLSDDPAFENAMRATGVKVGSLADARDANLILANGKALEKLEPDALRKRIMDGATLYWHQPSEPAYGRFQAAIGAKGVRRSATKSSGVLRKTASPLLYGIAREDFVWTGRLTGWDHKMEYDGEGSAMRFLPVKKPRVSLPISKQKIEVSHAKDSSFAVLAPKKGLYRMTFRTVSRAGKPHLAEIFADETSCGWFRLDTGTQEYETVVNLPKGKSEIAFAILKIAPWERPGIELSGIRITPLEYENDAEVLALPGSLVVWKLGKGRVILDGSNWHRSSGNERQGRRYMNAFLRNLGATFQ